MTSPAKLRAKPISIKEASKFVGKLHRHHGEPQGGKFAIGATIGNELVGVVITGRPVSRMLDNGIRAEVTRLCTDGTKNVCSFLYGAAARTAKEMGYCEIVTYILASEPGTSLKAAGWKCEGVAGGGSWSRESRTREDKAPTEKKVRWSRLLSSEIQVKVKPEREISVLELYFRALGAI